MTATCGSPLRAMLRSHRQRRDRRSSPRRSAGDRRPRRPVVCSSMRPTRIGFSCISVCHSSTSARLLAVSVARNRSGPSSSKLRLRLAEFRRAEAFRAFRSDDQRAAGLENIERRHHALDGLIIGLVERIAGRRRDDRREPPRQRARGSRRRRNRPPPDGSRRSRRRSRRRGRAPRRSRC